MTQTRVEDLAQLIATKDRIVAFTGAGISVESGIPDFRSAEGLWARFDPMEYATIDAFVQDPERVWKMLMEVDSIVKKARPNEAHQALAQLEKLGKMDGIITQNIDNLHQEAGSTQVIEYHGNAKRLVCACGFKEKSSAIVDTSVPPRCDSCGAILKPDVVLFGEPIPEKAAEKAMQLAQDCNLFLSIGTSAMVAPASYLPMIAQKTGAIVVEINLEETSLSKTIAKHSLRGRAGELLPRLLDRVKELLDK
jgi:NAD-dependent deacetylase